MENIYGELEDFLDEIGTHVSHNPATHAVSGSSNHPHSDMVVSALNEVVSWAENQSDLYQVFLVTLCFFLPLPQRLMRRILALEFVEMRELLPEEWLPSVEEGDQDSHSIHVAARLRGLQPTPARSQS